MHVQRYLAGGLLALAPLLAGAQTRSFDVDAGASDVHWRIYKAGAFSRFGHNHVISVDGLEGTVELAADGTARWTLSFDVAGLVVDDPDLRDRYGEDFASEPTADDIAGTKTNMLSETVLNGEQFGTITLSGGGSPGDDELPVSIEILGRAVDLTIPASVRLEGDMLVAEGEFSLQHADLGMEPFSVMMGALQVGPQIDFSYRIHATAVDR